GMAIVDAAREGASRRFRAVMMTAVSFIIGVLPLIVASRAGAPTRPNIPPNLLNRNLVANLVGIFLKPAHLLLLQPQRHLGQRHNENYPKTIKI
ncbi:efflux RND transporter permease subunit, partial [Enterobacter hormaechei]